MIMDASKYLKTHDQAPYDENDMQWAMELYRQAMREVSFLVNLLWNQAGEPLTKEQTIEVMRIKQLSDVTELTLETDHLKLVTKKRRPDSQSKPASKEGGPA